MAPTRSWTSRSQTTAPPASTEKHAARLHERSRTDEFQSERASPLRSRHSWQRGVAAGSPRTAGPSLRHGSDARRVGGSQKIAGPADSPTTRKEVRYTASEAYAVDAEVCAEQKGWILPSGKQVPQCHGDGNFRILGVVPSASVGGGSSAFGGNDSNNLTSASGIEKGSAGSSFRSGGRGNLFFGADFAGQRQREVHALAEKTDVAEARLLGGAETATPLGVEGSSEEVYAEGHKLFGNVRGEGRGSECSKTLALDDAQNPSVGSGAGSVSVVGKTEAPPGLAPLGENDQSDVPGLMDASGSRGSTGRVDFPPGFNAGRKGSDSDDSANGKARGDGSLGTKSGSTSLLSMLSASPRSLSTARDSAAGSPSPRTPLSDDSSETRHEVGVGRVACDTARRHRSAPIARSSSNDIASTSAHEPWISGSAPIATVGTEKSLRSSSIHSTERSSTVSPSVAPPPATSRFNVPAVITTIDDDDLPSAHPTPLYALDERDDDDVPSAHPTPLSTAGRSRPGKSDGSEGERSFDKNTAKKPTNARVRRHVGGVGGSSTAPSETLNPSASSFIDRLKYFGGGSVVSASTRRNAKTRAAAAAWQGRDARSPPTSEHEEISPAERRGMPVAPITDSLEEPSPALCTKSLAVEAPSRQYASNTASIAEETPSTPRVVTAGEVAAFARECASNATSIAQGDPEVRRIPSPSPGRYRHRQHRPGALADELFPAFVPRGPSIQVSTDSDAGSVFNTQKYTDLVSVGSQLGVVAEIPPVASGTPGSVVASSNPGRRSSFVETVGHEDELIDRVLQDPQEGFNIGEDESEESDMDWEAGSDDEEKLEEPQSQQESRNVQSSTPPKTTARPRARGLGAGPHPIRSPVAPPAPRYMAIVDAASANSALNSSTSEHDTSLSEDDGGMMAEILTDRLMEVAHKMEAAAPPPADDLSDGEGVLRVGGEGGRIGVGGGRRRAASRAFSKDLNGASSRRHVYQSSALPSCSLGGLELEEKGAESDEESVVAESAAARKLRRERVRKRSRSNVRRNLSAVLNMPVDASGAPINVHTAAYNGHEELLEAYITQGGDIEARDQFQATALMLCAERGHVEMVDVLLAAGADTFCVDENGNSALHLACFYGNREVVRLLLTVDCDVTMTDAEGRTPLQLATDPVIRRLIQQEEVVRISGDKFDLLEAVEVNDTSALFGFIQLGQEACGYPGNMNAVVLACKRLRLNRQGRGGMTAVHLAAFHGYVDSLRILLEAGADPNAVCDDGETPLHTACTGGSTACATLLLDHGGNPLATDAKGLVPCEKHIAAGRHEMKRLLEAKAFQATPANLMAIRKDLAEVALQIDAEEDLFVRKGVAIKYLRKALKKKEQDTARLRAVVDARDNDIRNLRDRMDSVYSLISCISPLS